MPSLLNQYELEAVQSAFERCRGERGFVAGEMCDVLKWALSANSNDGRLQALISGEADVDVTGDHTILVSTAQRRRNRSVNLA